LNLTPAPPASHTQTQTQLQHTTLYAEKNWTARVGTALRRKKCTNYYNFFPPNANSPIWPSTRPKLNTVQHSELKFTRQGGHICGKKPQKVNCSHFSPTHLCGLHSHSPSKQMRLPLVPLSGRFFAGARADFGLSIFMMFVPKQFTFC